MSDLVRPMSMLRALSIGLVLLSSPALAGKICYFKDVEGTCLDKDQVEPIHRLKRGTPYAAARAALIKEGYTPRSMRSAAQKRCSIGRDECETYPETMACSGSGRAFCSFLFDRGDSHYSVQTYGEDALYDGARFVSDQEYAELQSGAD